MKIRFQGTELSLGPYASWQELFDDYVAHETEHGRKVPSYSWEVLVGAVALWVLKKAADTLWNRLTADGGAAGAERRHRELLQAIGTLKESLDARRPEPVREALDAAGQAGAVLEIDLETAAERELAASLREHGARTEAAP